MADDGALWAGGDFNYSYTSLTSGQWSGGFVRMPARNTTAPAVPANLRASNGNSKEVTLKWSSVPGAVSYDILRDDRPIATTTSNSVTVPLGGKNRFFVRAVASDGLRGASTHAYVVDSNGKPAQPDDSSLLVDEDDTWAYHWSTDPVAENGPRPRSTTPHGAAAPPRSATVAPDSTRR